MDLLIRNARLPAGLLRDIAIQATKIKAITANYAGSAMETIDADGRLVIPAFVNGQLHAGKSFWRRLLPHLTDAQRQLPPLERAAYVKRTYSAADVFARVDEVMRLAIKHGTCAIRLFGDVDESAGLAAIEGLLQIKAAYQHLMTVQVVAFPQDGFAKASTERLLRTSLEMGADIVGGIPWIEADRPAQERHTKACFALATEYDRDLHFVCDDALQADLRSLTVVAEQTIAHRFQGRVAATQCAALAAYSDGYANKVITKLRQAGITIFSNSHVALITTGFDAGQQPWPRGITRIHDLLQAGVPVACAQDDIDNWFYPFGRNDMLEVAQYMAHNGRFAWDGAVDQVLPMVTTVPAQVMGLKDYGLAPDCRADLVILAAPGWHEAVQFQPAGRVVVLGGKIVAQTESHTHYFLR